MIRLLQAAYHQAALLWYTCVTDPTAEDVLRAAMHRSALDDYLEKGE